MCPRRALALGLEAAAVLGLLAGPAAAAPQMDCRPGAVAFETVHLPGRNVTLLRRGPGCPALAPNPPTTSTAPRASVGAAEASLVDDAPGGAFLAPSSALHGGSPHGHSAGLRRSYALTCGVTAIGVLATIALLAAISGQVWDRNGLWLLAQKAAEDEAERARLASEEADRQVREAELGRMAREEAERRAREEAEQRAREEATALAQRALLSVPPPVAAEAAPGSARSTRGGASRGQYDDHTRAFQLARQKEEEEEQRKSQQEQDDVHKKGQDAAEAKPEKKGRCGPCGCSSGKGAAEPGRR